ncbi:MAG: stringent starvation protein B [Candidatus Accumulibacter regalis]|uniref:ClpXP protease specificity-enhancing factor n=1 Tax=Candidatus Accumulibacter sp. ACC005 TaxID=2823331 RepID=UPI0025B9B0DA|nr:ClpXP protease specificity-enhancing factor [Candidatus Accumulibacter sp. ACC005]HRI90838.1 ClpXP protease specificity-enhancing factor [Accumulibacter sp.]
MGKNLDLPSTKPYLIRAIHQWCTDNGFTPYLAVTVDARTRVPMEHVRDGQIVLNVGYEATGRLELGNEVITFQARFGGVARDLLVPIGNVAAIYAKENGAGMAFEAQTAVLGETDSGGTPPGDGRQPEPPKTPPPAGRPKLQRVK